MTDLIAKLNELAEKANAGAGDDYNKGLFLWLDFAQSAFKAWPEISARLKAAEAVCEAAGFFNHNLVFLPRDEESFMYIDDDSCKKLNTTLEKWRSLRDGGSKP